VKVMITELDVDPLPRENNGADMAITEKGANPYPNSLPLEAQNKLAKRYGEIVAAILRHPAVTMICFWGPHDGRSWLNNFPVKGRTNHPLLFDREYRPKPAFDAVLKALKADKPEETPCRPMATLGRRCGKRITVFNGIRWRSCYSRAHETFLVLAGYDGDGYGGGTRDLVRAG